MGTTLNTTYCSQGTGVHLNWHTLDLCNLQKCFPGKRWAIYYVLTYHYAFDIIYQMASSVLKLAVQTGPWFHVDFVWVWCRHNCDIICMMSVSLDSVTYGQRWCLGIERTHRHFMPVAFFSFSGVWIYRTTLKSSWGK